VNIAVPRVCHTSRASGGAITPSSRARSSASIELRDDVATSCALTRMNAGAPAAR